MHKWYQLFQKNTGLSIYIWGVFFILPFYFIFQSSSTYEIITGFVMVILFFLSYLMAFVSKGWQLYFWTSIQILISIVMTILFSYVYFSIFLAFFIGNIQHKAGFITLYAIHLVSMVIAINYGLVTRNSLLITQFPFILINMIAAILLPLGNYNRNKQEQLQGQLEYANKRISELVKLEERQRIARDLHDTLGQKLALIGLKSDLANKLIKKKDISLAQAEIQDVHQTARTALKEVRELVTKMRGTRIEDEIYRVKQILKAAQIEFSLEGSLKLDNTSLLTENVLSMCLKEAVTNIVKHSDATYCSIVIEPTPTDLIIRISDNGVGMKPEGSYEGNGLKGMKERLEFVNGNLEIRSHQGTTLIIKAPNVVVQPIKEAGI